MVPLVLDGGGEVIDSLPLDEDGDRVAEAEAKVGNVQGHIFDGEVGHFIQLLAQFGLSYNCRLDQFLRFCNIVCQR